MNARHVLRLHTGLRRDLSFMPLLVAALTTVAVIPGWSLSQTFTDVTSQAGVDYLQYDPLLVEPGIVNQTMSGGAAAGDVDGDGWVDLFVTRLDQPGILFRNLGMDGPVHRGFQDVTLQAFPTLPTSKSNGAAFGDIDNDGDLDLYVTTTKDTHYDLYVNDGQGAFTEQALARGAAVDKPDTHFGNGIALGDYDGDGFLDVYITEWRNARSVPGAPVATLAASNNRLLRNRGSEAPGYFQDVTESAGVAMDHVAVAVNGSAYEGAAFGFAPRFSDLDADGHADLILTADFQTSRLFWNDGDGTFTDGTIAAGVGTDLNGMGSTVGDFNGDGHLDWFVTAIDAVGGNRLYRNEGNRTFSDQTGPAGVQKAGWAWGTTFLDYDNDGDQDLIMTNGFDVGAVPHDRTTLFRNEDGRFTDVSVLEGITDMDQGRGLLTLDYNNDGHLDVFLVNNGGHPILYRNNGTGNNWLRIITEGTESNRDGIGSRITVVQRSDAQESVTVREVDGGSNYLGHNELAAHFGLGSSSEAVDLVTIRWPSGIMQMLNDVEPNQIIQVVEPNLAEHDGKLELGSDAQASLVYNAGTGEVAIDLPAGMELTSLNINSAAGIFLGDPGAGLDGILDNDTDRNIFKATLGQSFGSVSFGSVAQSGLPEAFVVGDLSVMGLLADGGDLRSIGLIYIPEPNSAMLLMLGTFGLLARVSRRCD